VNKPQTGKNPLQGFSMKEIRHINNQIYKGDFNDEEDDDEDYFNNDNDSRILSTRGGRSDRLSWSVTLTRAGTQRGHSIMGGSRDY